MTEWILTENTYPAYMRAEKELKCQSLVKNEVKLSKETGKKLVWQPL